MRGSFDPPTQVTINLRNAGLDSLLKTQLIHLCKDNGLPTGCLKLSLMAQHMMVQQVVQQAIARVLEHFALPSAAASYTASPQPLPLFCQLQR